MASRLSAVGAEEVVDVDEDVVDVDPELAGVVAAVEELVLLEPPEPPSASATVATSVLGMMLGVVFLLAGRSLAPCIVSHFIINLLIEPGLVLAATRGEMGSPLRST